LKYLSRHLHRRGLDLVLFSVSIYSCRTLEQVLREELPVADTGEPSLDDDSFERIFFRKLSVGIKSAWCGLSATG